MIKIRKYKKKTYISYYIYYDTNKNKYQFNFDKIILKPKDWK